MTERALFRRAILLFVMAMGACSVRAGTITLRPGATLEAPRPATLGDVATLEGDDAQAFAGLVLGQVEERREITLAEVRAALDAKDVNWGRLALRGSVCTVRVEAPKTTTSVAADSPATTSTTPGVETIRDRVLATLRELFGAEPDGIRVTLDEGSADLLARPINGRRVDIETTSASSSRLAIHAWMYDGDRLIVEGTTRADVSLRLDVFTLNTAVGKGDRIGASLLSRATLWLSPTGAPPIREESQAVGAVARTRLDAGTVLRADHVEAPLVIKRGDLVTVHALAGSMVLKTKARAMDDAREGEMIELSRGRDRKPFLARAAGPGLAVLEADTTEGER